MKMHLSGSMLTKYHQIVTTAETLHPHRRGQNHYQNIVQCHSKCQSVSLSHEMKQQAVSCSEGGRSRYNAIRARASAPTPIFAQVHHGKRLEVGAGPGDTVFITTQVS